ncbi:hypothetical protein PR202_ga06711 [Eleusine coracana subsp. coracana]|uniref:Uncharacterized protein n=1 Tax=Eleusine coracana subsp. coracana TaxID=191504 RepID=A0AAV5BVL0_ELECO|nr:hypothetical protein PR202_ga06711 [Eleusine coracana subsp. coracana]
MAADLQFYLQLVIILAAPLLLFAIAARRAGSRRHGNAAAAQRLPPGPWALPIIGHLHHLAGALPHRALRDLARRHGPLMTLRLGELPVAVASSPAAAREIMKTHDAAFASRPMSPMQELAYQGAYGVIFAPHGEGWRQLRKICALELLSARRVNSFRPIREDEARRLLRAVAAAANASSAAPVNLSKGIAAYVADSTVRAIIGSRFTRRDAYLRMLHEGLKILPGMTLPDLFPSSRLALLVSRAPRVITRHRDEMQRFIDLIIEEHQESRASGGEDEDLLDVLLRLQREVDSQSPLTTENIKTVMLDMFGAGSETAATTLQWAMGELLKKPKSDAEGARRDNLPPHTRRSGLHPPAPLLLPRKCGSPCRVLGYDIPEGTHGDREAWGSPGPGALGPARRFAAEIRGGRGDFKGGDFELIPFAPERMCPGMAFGLARARAAALGLGWPLDKDLDIEAVGAGGLWLSFLSQCPLTA